MLLSLPPEIIVRILRDLHPYDYPACGLTCKYLHNLIQNSSELQYYAALLPALAEDNPCSNLPVAEKLNSLRRSEHAWSVLRPGFSKSVPVTHVQSGVYDLTAGVYFLCNSTRNALYYVKLPSCETDEVKWEKLDVDKAIIDIGLCLYEHDLIVIVTSVPVTQHESLRPLYRIELQLIEFSTGKPHPDARESHIHVMNSLWEKPAIGIEIVGENIVLILSFNTPQRPEDRVFIYEWKTSTLKTSWLAPYRSYSGLLFLTENLVLIPNTRNESLDIFQIPSKPTLDIPTPILVLKLPALAEGRVLGGISTRAEPNPIGSNSRLGGRGSDPTRPFLARADEAICIFDLRVLVLQMVLLPGGGLNMNFQFRHRFTFITHRKALIALVERYGRKDHAEVEVERGRDRREDRTEGEEVALSLEENAPGERHEGPSVPSRRSASPSESEPSNNSNQDENPDELNSSTSSTSPGPPTLSYSLWGPSITRWFNSDNVSTHWITTTAGQRCVQMEDNTPGQDVPIVVLDFNPAHVKERKRLEERRRRRKLAERLKRALGKKKGPDLATTGPDAANAKHFVPEADGGGEHWEEGGANHLRIPGRFTPSDNGDDELDDMEFDKHDEYPDDEHGFDNDRPIQSIRRHRPQFLYNEGGDHSTHGAGPSAFAGTAAALGSDHHFRTEEADIDIIADDGEVEEGDFGWDMQIDDAWGADDHEATEDYFGDDDSISDEDIPSTLASTSAYLDWTSHSESNGAHHLPRPFSPSSQTQPEEDEDRIWVTTSLDQLQPAENFQEPVLGGLPYVACATEQNYCFDGVLLDEERILGLKTNLTDHIERVEILHFG